MSALVLIPARMGSTRLPGKPLADIGGRPMIVHVAEKASHAAVGRVAVATDSHDVFDAVRSAGFEAVMTGSGHPSGSDRIFEAAELLDPEGAADRIINLQGDLPLIDPALVAAVSATLDQGDADIATLAAEIVDPDELENPNVVKAIGSPSGEGRLRALYFTRAAAPWGQGPHYHHIGIYAYRRPALGRFVALPPSTLEQRERLEQLRALEAGMKIDIAVVGGVPLGVDTPEDLDRARARLAADGM